MSAGSIFDADTKRGPDIKIVLIAVAAFLLLAGAGYTAYWFSSPVPPDPDYRRNGTVNQGQPTGEVLDDSALLRPVEKGGESGDRGVEYPMGPENRPLYDLVLGDHPRRFGRAGRLLQCRGGFGGGTSTGKVGRKKSLGGAKASRQPFMGTVRLHRFALSHDRSPFDASLQSLHAPGGPGITVDPTE